MDTIINYYRFDISKAEEKQEYEQLCKTLESWGLKKLDSISRGHSEWYKKAIRPLDGLTISLDVSYLFDNQWNTHPTITSEDGLRVFDWAEAIYPNRDIKEGQYLTQTDEMYNIRANRFVCGYCGKQTNYGDSDCGEFCQYCLGSEYLEESNLHLLRLVPVLDKWAENSHPELTQEEYDYLLPLYVDAQLYANQERQAAKIEKQRVKILKEFKENRESNEAKFYGMTWLMDNGISIDNVIYYNHSGIFCFGWRHSLSESVKSELLDLLVEFPYEYELK